MSNKLFAIQEAAEILGVSTKTLRRWDQRGRLVPIRTAGNQRRYTQAQIEEFTKSKDSDSELVSVKPTAPISSAVSQFPSNSFLKHHFLLQSNKVSQTSESKREEVESVQAGDPSPLRESKGSEFKPVNPFKAGIVFASFVLIFSFIAAAVLTRYDPSESLSETGNQLVKFLGSFKKPQDQIKKDNLSFVPQEITQSVLQAAIADTSNLLLNVNVPATFQETVGIGTSVPEASAILDLSSEDKGFLAPRMTDTQRDAIESPATGLFIYNTITNQYNMYNGTEWVTISSDTSGGITAIGDVVEGEAFTETGTSGTSLFFNGTSGGKAKVTAGTITGTKTLTLPDATGTFITTGNLSSITAVGTIGTGVWNGTKIAVGYGGTGATTLTGILIGNGTDPITGVTTSVGISEKLTDETGTGVLVFGTSPAITTSLTTGSTSFDLLNTTATTVNFGAAATAINIGNASGNVKFRGTTTLNDLTYTWPSTQGTEYILQNNGSGTLSWIDSGTLPNSDKWDTTLGAIYPKTAGVLDLLVGSTATSSSKFAFINVNNGTPTATISANSGNNATTLTGTGVLGTTNKQTLTLGNSATGEVVLAPGGTTALTARGANLIGAGTLTGLTGLTSSGTITFSDFTSNGGVLFANGSGALSQVIAGSSLQCLLGGATPFFGSCEGSGSDAFWQQSSGGFLFPNNLTVDFGIGGTSTSAAKFAAINILTGTPTATISASSGNNATFLTGAGNLATANAQTLTLGGEATGEIWLQPNTDTGDFFKFQSDLTNLTLSTTDGSNFTITPAGTLNLNSTGDMTLDSSTDIVLDADGADVILKDGGTEFVRFTLSGTDDVTINAAGGNILSSDVLNIGGAVAAAYNFFAADTAGASTPDGASDLYIQDELEVDGTVTFGSYGSIGGGSAVSADSALIIDYDATYTGVGQQLLVKGTVTGAASTNVYGASITPESITIPSGTTAIAASLYVAEPNITATGAVTNTASAYIASVATEAGGDYNYTNYALWVDTGPSRFDGVINQRQEGTLRKFDNGLDLRASEGRVAVAGKYAYIQRKATGSSGSDLGYELLVVDIASPSAVATFDRIGGAEIGINSLTAPFVGGKYAYAGTASTSANICLGTTLGGCEFHIYDISNPVSVTAVGGFDVVNDVNAFYVAGSYAYLGTASNASNCDFAVGAFWGCELRVIDVSNPALPKQVAAINIGSKVTSLYATSNYLYVGDSSNVVARYDISDPANPTSTSSVTGLGGDPIIVGVSGAYIYLTTQTAAAGTCSGTVIAGCEFKIYDIRDETIFRSVGGSAFTVGANAGTVAGNYAYIGMYEAGAGVQDIEVIDISNPYVPVDAGGYEFTATDAVLMRSLVVSGKYLYSTNDSEGGLTNEFHIFDLDGILASSATIGSIAANNINVSDNAFVGHNFVVGNSFIVGPGGMQSQGLIGSTRLQVVSSDAGLMATSSSTLTLDVLDHSDASAAAQIWNTSPDANADGLIIKLGNSLSSTTVVASTNHFISFETAGIGIVGSVQGSGGTGVTYATSGIADFAEFFKKDENQTIEYGSVVCLDKGGLVVPCDNTNNKILGVASERPAFLGGQNLGDGSIEVGLVGLVETFVSTASGTIEAGDALTISSVPGVAVKATKAGQIVGKALEPFTGTTGETGTTSTTGSSPRDTRDTLDTRDTFITGKILVAVNVGWYDPSIYIALDGSLGGILPEGSASQGETLQAQIASASAGADFVLSEDPLFKDLQNRVAALESTINLLSQEASISAFLLDAQNSQVLGVASDSAELINSIGNVEISNATISDDLMVLGRTTVIDMGVTGNITAGLLSIHGLDSEINTLAGDLFLQKNGLGGIDILDGKIVIDTNGNLESVGTITAKKINIDTDDAASSAVGSGVIESGQKSVVVSSTAVTENSKIFVTATSATGKQSLFVKEKTSGVGFKVEIETSYSQDIAFDWWIVN